MDDAELLPCPFCGNPAFAADMRLFDDGKPSYVVHCRGCDAQTVPCVYPSPERSRAEAMHRWNQRVIVVDDGSLLLPCPCCGGDAGVGHVDLSSAQVRKVYGESYDALTADATGRYLVAASCKTCGLFAKPFNYSDYQRSKSEAVHAWNQRFDDVLSVPTKPDLSPVPQSSPLASPAKSSPVVVFFAVLVIAVAVWSIGRSLSAW